MKILALELSTAERSVAAWEAAGGEPAVATESRASHTRVFFLIAEALAAAGMDRKAVEGMAVGLGPGSYTGIRMAIAVAQGWHVGRTLRLWGISSFEVMAAGLWRLGRTGEVVIAADAQRREAYVAVYRINKEGWTELEPLRLMVQAAVPEVAGGRMILGPDASQWCPGAEDFYPAAADLARLALQREPVGSPAHLAPIYLREAHFAKAPPARKIEGL